MAKNFDVDLNADCTKFVSLPTRFEILGVVTRAGVPCGALGRDPFHDVYVEIDGALTTPLDRDEAVVALALARKRKLTSGASV